MLEGENLVLRNTKGNTLSWSISFQDLILVAFFSFVLFSSSSASFLYIAFFLFVLWIIVASFKTNIIKYYLLDAKNLILLILCFYFFVTGLIGGTFLFSIKQVGATLIMYSPILVFDYYKIKKNQKSLPFVITSLIVVWMLCSVFAIYFYTTHPGSAKLYTADSTAFGNVAIGGGMLLGYGAAMLSCICVDMLFSKKHKISLLIAILLSLFLLFKTESTITLICSLVGIVFSLVGSVFKTKKSVKYLLFLFFVVAFAVFFFNIKGIGELVVSYGRSLNSTFGNRIVAFGYAMIGDNSNGSYAFERASLILTSLQTFFEHPLFGVAHIHGNGYLGVENYGVGNHSAWLDILANYGIVFGSMHLFIYFKQVLEVSKTKNNIFSIGWIVCLVVMGLFNPIKAWHLNFVLFFLIPSLNIVNFSGERK